MTQVFRRGTKIVIATDANFSITQAIEAALTATGARDAAVSAAGTATTQAGIATSAADAAATSEGNASSSEAAAGASEAAASESAADAANSAAAIAPYASRAEAIAATVPAPVHRISVIHAGRVLDYIRDEDGTALATNGGSVDWSPAGLSTPQHFGAVGDGVSDDSAALLSWLEWSVAAAGPSVAPRAAYAVLSPIVVGAFDVDFSGSTILCLTGEYDEFDHEGTSGTASAAQGENYAIKITGACIMKNAVFQGDDLGGWTSGISIAPGAFTARWHNIGFRDFGARAASFECDEFVGTGGLHVENCQNCPELRPSPITPVNYVQGALRIITPRFSVDRISCETGYHRAISISNAAREYATIGEVFSSTWDGTLSGAQVFYTNLTQNVHVGRIVIKDYHVPTASQFGGAAIYLSRDSTNVSCLDCHVVVTDGPQTARAFVSRGNVNVQLHGYFRSPSQIGVIEGHRNAFDAHDITMSGVFESDIAEPASPLLIRADEGDLDRVTIRGEFRSNSPTNNQNDHNAFLLIEAINDGTTGDIFLENVWMNVTTAGDGGLRMFTQRAGKVYARGIRYEKIRTGTIGYCVAMRDGAEYLELSDFLLATVDGQTVVWTSSTITGGVSLARNGFIRQGRLSMTADNLTSRIVQVVTVDGALNPNTAQNTNLGA